MKKLILIALIVSICISVVGINVVLAKAKFGNWDKWDEQLPPWDNKDWNWLFDGKGPWGKAPYPVIGKLNGGDNNLLLISQLYFEGIKRVLVIFYSSGQNDIENWNISNADLALAAFPPKKGKMVIWAYKMENQMFKFFEEWEIPFENEEIVVPQDAKFREIFKKFVVYQVERLGIAEELFAKISKEEVSTQLSPKIQIDKTGYYMRAP